MVFVEGVKRLAKSVTTFRWEPLLEELHRLGCSQTQAEERVLPVALFGNPPLGHFLQVLHTGLKLEVRHYDYQSLFPDKKIYWIATVHKIVGYCLLMRYEGMDCEGDEQHDFWVNIGSDDLKQVGHCTKQEDSELLPPMAIRTRQQDWYKYLVCKLHACKTLTVKWEQERQLSLVEGRFKLGTRLELIDRQYSKRVRPARVIHQLGRRICVRISPVDVDREDFGDDTGQVTTGIWCDESWELIFPVGWGRQNGWNLVANQDYVDHCEQIAQALEQGRKPVYADFDASPEIFHDWKESHTDNTVHWEVGMKFECLDPFNESFLELKVATCLELLKDGYLKVGFDGPDQEEDAIPIHSSSSYLFPINYAKEHGIRLVGPSETTNEISWSNYLRQCKATPAPHVLFDPIPPHEKMAQFKVGAKMEATDQCESHLICPATVRAVRGRLLQIHFDGWDDDYDQLFDYRSRDLFPLGWCEMYGYKLEAPKGNEPQAKRRKK